MLISSILTQARKLVNDTDTSDPFHTDTDLYELFSDWLQEVAMEYGYPHEQQAITFAINDGGAAGTKNLNIDLLSILACIYEPTTGNPYALMPKTEAEMALFNPNWRNEAAAMPTYYIIQDAITAGVNQLGPQRTITTDRLVSLGGTMRIYGIQIPAVIAAGTNSPVYAAQLHKSGVYYLAAHMSMPRDKAAAKDYLALHVNKLRRCKTLLQQQVDPNTPIWDQSEDSGWPFTQDRLSR